MTWLSTGDITEGIKSQSCVSSHHLMGVQVWNPAFDVTPSSLIQGIITEQGIVQHKGGGIDMKGFLQQQGLLDLHENGMHP